MTQLTLYQVKDSSDTITHQWMSTDNGPDFYSPRFGRQAWTEYTPIIDTDGNSVLGEDGLPTYTTTDYPATFSVVATDITGTSRDPRMVALRSQRDMLLSGTKWIQERHQDELALGLPTTLSQSIYTNWLQYWQALRALPDSTPDLDAITWPAQPPTKG
jgi:hypothetical protein